MGTDESIDVFFLEHDTILIIKSMLKNTDWNVSNANVGRITDMIVLTGPNECKTRPRKNGIGLNDALRFEP